MRHLRVTHLVLLFSRTTGILFIDIHVFSVIDLCATFSRCNKECNTVECFFDGLDCHELPEYDGGREIWFVGFRIFVSRCLDASKL